jgi:hypothetical protein
MTEITVQLEPPSRRSGSDQLSTERHSGLGQNDARVPALRSRHIILVTSRPSEDVMAVYDGHQRTGGNYLWRVMGRDGLQSGETLLVTQFEKGFDSVQKHK